MLSNIKIDKKKFVIIQISLILIGTILIFATYGASYTFSFLIGSLTMFLANFIFFFRLFIDKQFSPGIEILIFYLSEMVKLMIIALVTILLTIYVKPKLFAYIFGLVLLQLVVCFVPILFKKVR